ncbi:MAG: glycosyltransferase family 9 protein [Planctomycetia bacterium]|nr:glycosyltransferase family 9 protein [Planctomycetia bacterium]
MNSPTQQLRRILLVRNDRIGDLVLTLPAFEAVRRHWPQAHVAALVSPYAGPLLAGSRAVNELLVDDEAESPWQLGGRLRKMRFDAALVFNTNSRNCLAVWRARIRQRVCWAYKPAGYLLGNRRVEVHRSHPPIHEAEFALAFVRRLGATADLASLSPRLALDATTCQRVAGRIQQELGRNGPLFGIHPGNKNSAYNWPAEHYTQLVSRLAEYGRVMITGSPAESPLLESIRGQLTNTTRSRVGFYTNFQLLELAAALSVQTVLTVSSTGPMHMAGILGTPVVALFSPHPAHAPEKWAPLGSGHTLLVAPLKAGEDPRIPRDQGTATMARISVEQVLEANLKYARQALAVAAASKHGPTNSRPEAA